MKFKSPPYFVMLIKDDIFAWLITSNTTISENLNFTFGRERHFLLYPIFLLWLRLLLRLRDSSVGGIM